jgi:hypothetical protein
MHLEGAMNEPAKELAKPAEPAKELAKQLHQRLVDQRAAGDRLAEEVEHALDLYDVGELGGLELTAAIDDAVAAYRRLRVPVE